MPESQLTKNNFRLNRGLNTESNEVSFPDGFTTDERNYELLVDGSRRRRKGLARETGGALKATAVTIGAATAHTSFKWRGVGGDPDKNFIVHQVGSVLFFTDDAELISTTYHVDQINLEGFKAAGTVTQAQIEAEHCQFDSGRGNLFVVNKFCKPFHIEYDATGDTFTAHRINIQVRDFDGIDDGVANQVTPTALSADHEYNLRNRGWIAADITTFKALPASVHPSKAMVWFKGYRRQTDVSFSDLDGIQVFSALKLEQERFGQSSAVQGGLFLNPLDTRFSASTTNEGVEVQISTIVFDSGSPLAGGVVRITTATNHGRDTSDTVTISGTLFDSNFLIFASQLGDVDGFFTITKISDTVFTYVLPSGRGLENPVFSQTGQVNGNVSLPKSDGKELAVGPTAVAYHAGRVWYAGIADSEWADTLFFTKIAQKPISYGFCHQEGDPTNPEFNQLSSSDGGTIVIPNMGQVKRILDMRGLLLVFSDKGVWEVGGGQRGIFTATGFSVRKISDAECTSALSPIRLGTTAIYTGPRGIHRIAPNEFTSALEEQNVSEQLIQTLWNDIPAVNQRVVQTVHDEALDRVYFLYGDSGLSGSTDNINQYARLIVLDLRVGAWYKYVFNVGATSGILTAFSITESDTSDSRKKVKFTVQSVNNLDSTDFDQTDFLDYDGAESPLPFMVTGHDDIGDFQSRRQAPVITVYAKKTETGFIATGNGLDPVNESSNLMTAFWDWTDDLVSGKQGTQNETYRHVRGFQPVDVNDTFQDGYPVVVTRNKVRGRGRVLQLRFDGAATKDSHLLGFTTNYKVSRGK